MRSRNSLVVADRLFISQGSAQNRLHEADNLDAEPPVALLFVIDNTFLRQTNIMIYYHKGSKQFRVWHTNLIFSPTKKTMFFCCFFTTP